MALIEGILDALEDLQCPHLQSCLTEDGENLRTDDVQPIAALISWFSNELQVFHKLESLVTPIQSKEDSTTFIIELNELLRELNAPVDANGFFDDKQKQLVVINYLASEVQAARLCYKKGIATGVKVANGMAIEVAESDTARDLKNILIFMNIGKPPNNINAQGVFQKIQQELGQKIKSKSMNIEDPLLLPKGMNLSPQQWAKLEQVNQALKTDYTLRRETLLTRCDCTTGSFKWKAKLKEATFTEKEVDEILQPLRKALKATPEITMADALAARRSDVDELLNSVVSGSYLNVEINTPVQAGSANQGVQQRLSLHKYLIGKVPDRGGRPHEQPPPPKESYSQQEAQRAGGGRGRGGGYQGNRGGHQGRGGYQGGGNHGGGAAPYRDSQPQAQPQPQPPRHGKGPVQGAGWAGPDKYRPHYERDNRQAANQQGWNQSWNQGYNQPYQQQGYQQAGYQQGGYTQPQGGGYQQQYYQHDNRGDYHRQPRDDRGYDNRGGGYRGGGRGRGRY